MAQQPDDHIPAAVKQGKETRWGRRIPRWARVSAAIILLLIIVGTAGWFLWHQLIVAGEWLSLTWRGSPPALRVLLCVAAIWGLTVGIARLALAIMKRRREKKVRTVTPENACWVIPSAIIVLWGVITLAVMCIESRMKFDITKEQVHFIYQIITGNWSSPTYIQTSPPLHKFDLPVFRIGASVSFAIVLNLASLGLFAWLFKRIRDVQKEIRAMKSDDVILRTVGLRRDSVIGTNVVDAVSKVAPGVSISVIRGAVFATMARTDNELENKILPEMYGPEKAQRIVSKIKELKEAILS
jgi:hypothetical protein